MSRRHPIIGVTGSSGAGTSTVKVAFEHIMRREDINAAIVEGDAFHKYNRDEMKKAIEHSEKKNGRGISHFGPEGNVWEELETLFREYANTGKGKTRLYLHNDKEAEPYGQPAGTFTPWMDLPPNTHLLFYEGLHGGVRTEKVDVAQHVDLLVGVVPVVNLEWIQKIHRDMNLRGYSAEAVTATILRRMHDYVHYITPQFSRTHINFQRVPIVDTSNPFVSRDIPTLDESLVVIRFRNPRGVDFPYLITMIDGSFMSRPNNIVVPGGKMGLAIELILTPLIWDMVSKSKEREFSI
ncbi:MAG TPA: phosphoribulokinase [Burkholderiales bacterium]